jgi:N-methylhydantoinase A
VARLLDIPEVVIPNYAGVFSALGFLMADVRIDEVRSYPVRLADLSMEQLAALFEAMEAKAARRLRAERYVGQSVFTRSIDMRYVGQNFESEVPIRNGHLTESNRPELTDSFNRLYEQLYAHHTDDPREILTLRLTAEGQVSKLAFPLVTSNASSAVLKGERPVFFGDAYVPTPVYDGALLASGQSLNGPAIIEKMDTTVVVQPGESLSVDPYGNLLVCL